MTPNRQSPAYALFARRPIVPLPVDVPTAEPRASQEPPSSGTEDTAECRLAKEGVLNECTTKDGQPIAHLNLLGGGKSKKLSIFVKQRTYRRDDQQRMNRTSFHGTLW
jgi:hypothetical protein